MKLEEFDAFVNIVIANLDNWGKDEYYGTDASIAETLLGNVRNSLFYVEIEKQKEYQEYLRLKAKFENE